MKNSIFEEQLVYKVQLLLASVLLASFGAIEFFNVLSTKQLIWLNLFLPAVLAWIFLVCIFWGLSFAEFSPNVSYLVKKVVTGVVLLGVPWWIARSIPAKYQITFTIGANKVNLFTLIENLWLAVLSLLVALWLSSIFERKWLTKLIDDLSVRKIVANLSKVLLSFIAALTILYFLGIDWKFLSLLIGTLGVGAGLGLQKLVANYVSGFILLMERAIRIGDFVAVDDSVQGTVMDIKFRHTVIQDLNGWKIIIPNEYFSSRMVSNASKGQTSILLFSLFIVPHQIPLALLKSKLIPVILSCHRVNPEPIPDILIDKILVVGLQLRVSYWISDPQNGQANVISEVNQMVLSVLHDCDIDLSQIHHTITNISL